MQFSMISVSFLCSRYVFDCHQLLLLTVSSAADKEHFHNGRLHRSRGKRHY